jgi:hypothetical protein
MADFGVPSQFRSALVQLAELNDTAIAELAKLLEENPAILISRDAAYESAAKLTALPAEETQAMLEALIPLLYFKASNSKSTAEMVKDITIELLRSDKNLPKLKSDRAASFNKNISKLLDLSAIAIKAKALAVATDTPHLFSEVKILSDMRPVFGEKATEAPLGAVLMHSLRIGFAKEGREREFFVHMDTRDLQGLQECVNRALDKDATIRNFLERTKLQLFETF